LAICRFVDLPIWRFVDLAICRFGDLSICSFLDFTLEYSVEGLSGDEKFGVDKFAPYHGDGDVAGIVAVKLFYHRSVPQR